MHRDIKPENILVDRRGTVKIADFGLAKLLSREVGGVTLTRSDQAMGTLHYMAPEQIRHPLEVDHRADIYSLGVVFYELLTGELPVGNFPLPSDQEGVDSALDEVVLKSLEREPERRYQGAGEVRTDVQRVSETRERRASSGRDVEAPRPRRRGHRPTCAIAGIGCLLLFIVGLGLLLMPAMFVRMSHSRALAQAERARAEEMMVRGEMMRDYRKELLESIGTRYAAIEADHTEAWERLKDGGLRVQIGPFVEERQALSNELRAGIEQHPELGISAVEVQRMIDEVLPFGRDYSVIEAHPTEGGWSWTDSAEFEEDEPGHLPLRTAPQLPRSLRRYLTAPAGQGGPEEREPAAEGVEPSDR